MRRRSSRAQQRLFALNALRDVLAQVTLEPVVEDVLLSFRASLRGRPLEEQEAAVTNEAGSGWQPFTTLAASDSLTLRHHYLAVSVRTRSGLPCCRRVTMCLDVVPSPPPPLPPPPPQIHTLPRLHSACTG
jgi:hypothetical protein